MKMPSPRESPPGLCSVLCSRCAPDAEAENGAGRTHDPAPSLSVGGFGSRSFLPRSLADIIADTRRGFQEARTDAAAAQNGSVSGVVRGIYMKLPVYPSILEDTERNTVCT